MSDSSSTTSTPGTSITGSDRVKRGLAEMLKGGVIMDVVNVDQVGVAHAGHAALGADVGGDALEGHDGDGAGILGDTGLLGGDDVHDDAALQHLGESALDAGGSGIGHVHSVRRFGRACIGLGQTVAWRRT